jgi:hypothetical protein
MRLAVPISHLFTFAEKAHVVDVLRREMVGKYRVQTGREGVCHIPRRPATEVDVGEV